MTNEQLKKLSDLLEKVNQTIQECSIGVLRMNEARGNYDEYWDEALSIVDEGSIEWRILDRSIKKHPTVWWRAETGAKYTHPSQSKNFKIISDAINEAIVMSKRKDEDKSSSPTKPVTILANPDESVSIPDENGLADDARDVFICHASEDKTEVVEPLIRKLDEENISMPLPIKSLVKISL